MSKRINFSINVSNIGINCVLDKIIIFYYLLFHDLHKIYYLTIIYIFVQTIFQTYHTSIFLAIFR